MFATRPSAGCSPIHQMLIDSLSADAIAGAVELKIFDYLEEQPATVSQLAERMGAVEDLLEPLLDIAAAAGLLKNIGGKFSNTETASVYLVSTAPCYQGKAVDLLIDYNRGVASSIGKLVAGAKVDREKIDDKWSMEDTMDGTAQEAIGSGLWPVVDYVASLPHFEEFRSMCDIGGNHGLYTMGVLEQNPELQGDIYDLPKVATAAQERCNIAGFEGRVKTHSLDFREDLLPANHFDLVLTSHVLYAFLDDLDSAVEKIANALHSGGWFVSHHYAGRKNGEELKTKATLELLTRLSGYSSHFVESEMLIPRLEKYGFTNMRTHRPYEDGFNLIIAAQKV